MSAAISDGRAYESACAPSALTRLNKKFIKDPDASLVGNAPMTEWLEFVRRSARQFRGSRSGNVATMFAIAIIPMMIGVGAFIDYSRLATVQTKLNHAADVATLGSVSKDAQPFLNSPTQASVQKLFNAAAAAITDATITSFSATITPSVTNLSVSVTYTASLPLVFGAFLGRPTGTVSGLSTASVNAPPYVNF